MNKNLSKRLHTYFISLVIILMPLHTQATQGPSLQLCKNIGQMHAPSIVESKPGELLLAFYGGEKVLNPDNKEITDCKIWLAYFNQEEQSWSTPTLIASSQEVQQGNPVPCLDPVLCKSPTGTIYLFYKIGTSTENWTGYLKSSADNGATWSAPRCLASLGAVGPHKSKPLFYTHTDEFMRKMNYLVCPSTKASWNFRAGYAELINYDLTYCCRSNLVEAPDDPHGILQQPVVFHTDSTLHMLFRVRNLPHIYRSMSYDGGRTWEKPEPVNELAGSDSSLDVIKLTNGKVLLAYNDITGSKRYRLVFMLSEGKLCAEWRQIKIIAQSRNQNASFCYPSIIQSSDGRVHLVYVKDYQEICYEIFTQEELI